MQLKSTVLFVHVCVEGVKSLMKVACLWHVQIYLLFYHSGFGSTNFTKFVGPIHTPAAFSLVWNM